MNCREKLSPALLIQLRWQKTWDFFKVFLFYLFIFLDYPLVAREIKKNKNSKFFFDLELIFRVFNSFLFIFTFRFVFIHVLHYLTNLCLTWFSSHRHIHRANHIFINRWIFFELLFKIPPGDEKSCNTANN